MFRPGDEVVAKEDCGVPAGTSGIVLEVFWAGKEYEECKVRFGEKIVERVPITKLSFKQSK